MIYCSVTTNNISRLVMAGFFMSVTESEVVEWNAIRGKSKFLEWNKFTSEKSELEKRKDIKSRLYFDIYIVKQNDSNNPKSKKNQVQIPKKNQSPSSKEKPVQRPRKTKPVFLCETIQLSNVRKNQVQVPLKN